MTKRFFRNPAYSRIDNIKVPPYFLGLCPDEGSADCELSENECFHSRSNRCGDCPYKVLGNEGGRIIIINEQHSLLPAQEELLQDYPYFLLKIPAQGLTLDEMRELRDALVQTLAAYSDTEIVFASPIPYLLLKLPIALRSVLPAKHALRIRLFHNDRREKKELPNGKVIYTIPAEGWMLI